MNDLILLQKEQFEFTQRQAKAFALSTFFPQSLKATTQEGTIANAVIVYDMANRMGLNPLEIAQSVFIIHGKPSFETKFLVSRLNTSGLIRGRLQTIITQDLQSAYCQAIDNVTGQTLTGTKVTMAMAQSEGWINKNGSKWKTMPELMLKYRAQSFFINEFFPEVKMGIKTKEELIDIDSDVKFNHFTGEIIEDRQDINEVLEAEISTIKPKKEEQE